MTDLTLSVKLEYFLEIKSGRKVEEFRQINDFWKKRIVGRTFDRVIITHGYPKKGDPERTLYFPWRGYRELLLTHPLFGIVPVAVFAIKLEN